MQGLVERKLVQSDTRKRGFRVSGRSRLIVEELPPIVFFLFLLVVVFGCGRFHRDVLVVARLLFLGLGRLSS